MSSVVIGRDTGFDEAKTRVRFGAKRLALAGAALAILGGWRLVRA